MVVWTVRSWRNSRSGIQLCCFSEQCWHVGIHVQEFRSDGSLNSTLMKEFTFRNPEVMVLWTVRSWRNSRSGIQKWWFSEQYGHEGIHVQEFRSDGSLNSTLMKEFTFRNSVVLLFWTVLACRNSRSGIQKWWFSEQYAHKEIHVQESRSDGSLNSTLMNEFTFRNPEVMVLWTVRSWRNSRSGIQLCWFS
jgi:hypothetical protein